MIAPPAPPLGLGRISFLALPALLLPSLSDTLKLRVQENVKRYARNYATLFILLFACSLYQMPLAFLGLISSLAIWDLFKFCSDKRKFDRYLVIRQVLVRIVQCDFGFVRKNASEVLVRNADWFSEDEVVLWSLLQARFFFQQLIYGFSYCHAMEICHRDLKLENTLLDGSPTPSVKICDFGYSKSGLLHSQTKSIVGTLAYIALEVLSRKEFDGKVLSFYCSSDFVCSNKHLVRIADGSMETFMRINR
ncbi:hypothetical protein Patl1_07396 [Pistacia atlantica]|uniref:Uncharacterized protein n=1 Tax=Pistacia atlantica TaxID=434234 RepID=A0ACC1AH21_9ROSI|nr:hypothetical protein Patl1_07396 [Pistacia atlantica]